MIKLEGQEGGDVCIPNIGPKERRKRLTFGIITLVVAAVIGAFFILSGWAWWTRVILFFPVMSGFIGIFQAREKT